MHRAGLVTAAALAAAVGCTGQPKPQQTSRSQAADDLAEKLANSTVGQKTQVGEASLQPIQVSAVGLVWKLNGTGSPAGGEWRPMLERTLRKQGLQNTKTFLDDPNRQCAMVLVSAMIPAGARKGDPIDVDIVLPRGSQTTSLKGGVLFDCELTTSAETGAVRDAMERAGQIQPGATPVTGNTLITGKTLVKAEGPLIAGTTGSTAKVKATLAADPDLPAEPTGYTVGRVWGGGRVLEDRPYWLILNEDDKNARLSMAIAARVNATFQPAADGRTTVAKAVTNEVVTVTVPPSYKLNHARFLVVARQVPLTPTGPDSLYRKKLDTELLDPETTVAAAVKLEALGAESQQPLRVGLQSQSPWVRFASAEALAYLGSTAGVAELARLAEQHPGVRSHALLALASLDDGVSADRLVELMSHPDAQLRYGAFVALRSANDRHPSLGGLHVKRTFWLHQVAGDSQGLVHLNGSRRAEVVLFGNVGELKAPFSIPLGREFVVSARAGDDHVTVAHIVPGADGARQVTAKAKPALAAVLAAVGDMGGGYSEAVELVRKADTAKVLAAAVAVDAAPRGVPLTQLTVLARKDPTLEQTDIDVVKAGTPGSELQLAGYDLPTEGDAVQQKPAAADEPGLNRNPGRLFAPKRHPSDPEPDAKPDAAKEKDKETDLARSPGKLFGK